MQTIEQQNQSNQSRLAAYRAKQTEDQRRHAVVAEQINAYSKKLTLELAQAWAAIRIGMNKLNHGHSITEACEAGRNAALTIVRASCNERTPNHRRRRDLSNGIPAQVFLP